MADSLENTIAGFADPEQLHRDGCILLRNGIPFAWLEELRKAFDEGVLSGDQWPVPRGADWRHACLDRLPIVQSVCHLPELISVVQEFVGERFFLSQVEGREPLLGGGHQGLHRDLSVNRPGDVVCAIAYLDDYGPGNGATRIVAGSHRPSPDEPPFDFNDASRAVQLSGCAGDILVFDADLLHAGSLNKTGDRRRSLLIGYFAEPLHASHLETMKLRNIGMEVSWFDSPIRKTLSVPANQNPLDVT